MNQKKTPQLFVGSGASRWGDPKNFPWTMGWLPTYRDEGSIYAQHILGSNPVAKVAVLYQNDDFGKEFHKGFMDRLGDSAKTMVVAQSSYEVTDPTINSQMVTLKASGANTLFIIATPKFAAQAIRKAAELGWKPAQYLSSVSISVSAVIKPAGPENAVGMISATFLRDPADPRWQGTKEYEEYMAWIKKYYPSGDASDSLNVMGYSLAQTLVQTLKQSGDNLTRENIMKQAANLKMTLPMLYPGIEIKTAPDDFYPIKRLQLMRFNGTMFEPFGKTLGR